MKHQISKIKFRGGKDANKMLMRKLLFNFLTHGRIITTASKAKALKTYIEKLAEKTKEDTNANRNYLLRYVTSVSIMNHLYTNVGPVIKDKNGGYVRVERLHQRYSDGAPMARVIWAYPVISEQTQAKTQENSIPEETVKKTVAKKS